MLRCSVARHASPESLAKSLGPARCACLSSRPAIANSVLRRKSRYPEGLPSKETCCRASLLLSIDQQSQETERSGSPERARTCVLTDVRQHQASQVLGAWPAPLPWNSGNGNGEQLGVFPHTPNAAAQLFLPPSQLWLQGPYDWAVVQRHARSHPTCKAKWMALCIPFSYDHPPMYIGI